MSFTTRCPACGTMFKVVPDQLKISDGWVRCGHCSDVFDAMLNLQGETAQSPPVNPLSWPHMPPGSPTPSGGSSRVVIRRTPIAAPPPPYSAPLAPHPVESPAPFGQFQPPAMPTFSMPPAPPQPPPAMAQPPHSDPGWAFVERPGEEDAGDPVMPAVAVGGTLNGPGDDWDSEWLLSPNSISRHREAVAQELQTQQSTLNQAKPPAQPVDKDFERELDAFSSLAKQSTSAVQTPEAGKVESIEAVGGRTDDEAVEADEDGDLDDPMWPSSHPEEDAHESGFDAQTDEPTFVVQARRDAFWRRPVMRAVLLLMAGGLSALLALQWASFDRDQLAARYPAMEPMLKQLCAVTGCSLTAPRRIEAVVIDSSTLTRKLGQFYSFDLVVKNTEPMAVAMPALELSLTDARDKEIARRVFLPEEMPGTPTIVPANGSLSVSMRLSLVESELGNMAGYRALVFYP